jgi:hypothetical protein
MRLGWAAMALLLALGGTPAGAADFDTEHLFGFTEGSDIGAMGERELELEFAGRGTKRRGTYRALSQATALKLTLTDDFRIAPAVAFDRYHIRGVPGLPDRDSVTLSEVAFEMKYRVLDRESAPVGLTLGATPLWGRVDTASGEPQNSYGVSLRALVDGELVADRLFAALNLDYALANSRSGGARAWEKSSDLAVATAVTARASGAVFLGVETRYERAHEHLSVGRLDGWALFLGPTLYARLGRDAFLSLAWNAQVAGRASGRNLRLDLDHFERNQVMVRFGVGF